MRLFIAIVAARTVRFFSRALGRGKGTSLPGLVALKIFPDITRYLGKQLSKGVVLVAGTNGKTTTAKLINAQLKAADRDVIANSSSANLRSGITSSLIENSSLMGRLKKIEAIFEVDEHALNEMVHTLPVKMIVITNLFRDQLDRYGEIDNIVNVWRKSLSRASAKVKLVVNGNDPRLLLIANNFPGPIYYFGTSTPEVIGKPNMIAADTTRCPYCRGILEGTRFMAHLGVLNCMTCSMKTPELNADIMEYNPDDRSGSQLKIKTSKGNYKVVTQLFGRFNIFNIAASIAASQALGLSKDNIISGIGSTRNVFGRSELIKIEDKNIYLHLAKNPTGYNEILNTLDAQNSKLDLLLVLNDNWADGQDISWIWDVDFEGAASLINNLTVSGQRAGDLAVRLRTANFKGVLNTIPNSIEAIDLLIKDLPNKLHIIASYTAMLFIRKELAARGLVKKDWK